MSIGCYLPGPARQRRTMLENPYSVTGKVHPSPAHPQVSSIARSWTTDAPYRETPAAIGRARDAGADCVEMESAALYAYAAAGGHDVLCLAHVTNTMAVSGDDFEKGQANGALAAIAMTTAISRVLQARPGAPDELFRLAAGAP